MPAFAPTFCGLLPHPPIIVPAVGQERHAECRATYDACRELARRLAASLPQRIFVVSPHSPRRARAFGFWDGDRLRGDLARFGAPEAGVDLPNDTSLRRPLEQALETAGEALWSIPPHGHEPGLDREAFLDHGAVIPLWFLAEAGWTGPTAVVSLPIQCRPDRLRRFGRALAQALNALGEPAALVASGDMSHRVLPGAPAGFHPRAVEFDHQLTELIRRGDLEAIATIDPELRELAAEDAADTSILVTATLEAAALEAATLEAATLENRARGAEVLSYEHPFGVGYLVAVFDAGTLSKSNLGRGDAPA